MSQQGVDEAALARFDLTHDHEEEGLVHVELEPLYHLGQGLVADVLGEGIDLIQQGMDLRAVSLEGQVKQCHMHRPPVAAVFRPEAP